ncbi:ATPase, T2SS/T4P/T4SS family [Paenibacillus faecalis]|uniref:ATPase, T2SS/T4P/T4SS family n=1 Tax=Paenibacillus faecalis TaxID=2079532 RepID=UPI000D0E3A75|nr:ATPase, T2SS/T4P/T4SS family [Paenibacillus faecalis]
MLLGSLVNLILIGLIFLLVSLFLYTRWMSKAKIKVQPQPGPEQFSLQAMTEFVKETLHQMTHSQLLDLGLHEEEYRRRLSKRSELRRALKGCVSGSVLDKQYVKEFMKELLIKSLKLNETNINIAIPFEKHDDLTPQDQFEIILYLYKQEYQDKALSKLIMNYDLARPRVLPGYGEDAVYAVTAEDIAYIYANEIRSLMLPEKLDIVVQRIYQQYKGFSVIDEIRDQRIDGVSGGVSGVLGDSLSMKFHSGMQPSGWVDGVNPASECESVWLFFRGISIHLGFLSFGSVRELKRVCQNIYKYNHPGQLSEASGFKVNEMKDGSRVVVVRPPFSESWAFFVRKFDVDSVTLEQLVKGKGAEIPIGLLQFLMKGSRITAITGAQGSGKTTLLMAMVRHIYASYTLRVQEMAFELHLRKIYSRRNILSFRETEHISGQEGLDLQKKTDGTVNILGEVATDEVASWMIQMSQVASLFTVFTHHAKTFKDLVYSLRNSLLKSGMFRQEDIAEQQVVSVINFDVHLKRDAFGNRFIERITECIPCDEEPFPSWEDQGKLHTFYVSKNVVEYRDGEYVAAAPLSERSVREMEEQMQPQDVEAFRSFIQSVWGGKP